MSTTTTVIPPDLAAFAWSALAEGRTHAMEAVDWFREQADTDDVRACKMALYRAAATSDALSKLEYLPFFRVSYPDFDRFLRSGELDAAIAKIEYMRNDMKGMAHDYKPAVFWKAWCDRADVALALCREISLLGVSP